MCVGKRAREREEAARSVSALIIYDFALSDKLNSHLVVLVFDNKDDVEDELEVHLLDADALIEYFVPPSLNRHCKYSRIQ